MSSRPIPEYRKSSSRSQLATRKTGGGVAGRRAKSVSSMSKRESDLLRLTGLSYIRLFLGLGCVFCGLLSLVMKPYLWFLGHSLVAGITHVLTAFYALFVCRTDNQNGLLAHALICLVSSVILYFTVIALVTYELWCDVGHHCDCTDDAKEHCHVRWDVVPVDILALFLTMSMLIATALAVGMSWTLGRTGVTVAKSAKKRSASCGSGGACSVSSRGNDRGTNQRDPRRKSMPASALNRASRASTAPASYNNNNYKNNNNYHRRSVRELSQKYSPALMLQQQKNSVVYMTETEHEPPFVAPYSGGGNGYLVYTPPTSPVVQSHHFRNNQTRGPGDVYISMNGLPSKSTFI